MNATSEVVHISLEAGSAAPAYRAAPTVGQSAASVLVLPEIWGVDENIRSVCDRLAQNGFLALAPDMYRGGKAPRETDSPQAITQSFRDYDDAQGVRDCRAFMRSLRAWSPDGARFYVWGFSMGGRFAHYLGACCEGLAGVVNFYGRLAFERERTKLFLPRDFSDLIEVPYLGLFAEDDPIVPLADVEELRSRFVARRHPHLLKVFRGAAHSFFNGTRAAYDAAAAAEAWHLTLRFFQTGSMY